MPFFGGIPNFQTHPTANISTPCCLRLAQRAHQPKIVIHQDWKGIESDSQRLSKPSPWFCKGRVNAHTLGGMRVSHVVIRGIPCSQAPIKQPPAATRASRPIRVNWWPHTWLEDPKNCCGSSTNGDRIEVRVMGEAFTTAMKCSVTNHNLG